MASDEAVRNILKEKLDEDQLDALLSGDAARFEGDGLLPLGLELTEDGALALYAYLGPVPVEAELARPYLTRVLELNQPGFLGESRLAMHDNEVVLYLTLDCDGLDASGFGAAFDAFAGQADGLDGHLREYLEELGHAGGGAAPASELPEPGRFGQGWVQA